jgi:hypothetical protein
MRMRLALLVLAACRFEAGHFTFEDAPARGDADLDARPIDALVDAKVADARNCPAAPATCKLFTCPGSSSCYYECGTTGTSKASWPGAAGSCTNANLGCIVTINDQAEQNCITSNTVPTFSSYVWFGYRQDASPTEPAGNWAWECPPSSYVQPGWGTSEPNDSGGNEDCAAMTNGGGWFDATCTGTARYVCELP